MASGDHACEADQAKVSERGGLSIAINLLGLTEKIIKKMQLFFRKIQKKTASIGTDSGRRVRRPDSALPKAGICLKIRKVQQTFSKGVGA